MKEPITGRDLFIISTICTGFGALLSWGLFYRWGSAPPSKPIDWPAWVQAIGSVLGIFSAVGIPIYINKLAEDRHDTQRLLRESSYALSFLDATEQLNGILQRANRRIARISDETDIAAIIEDMVVPESLVARLKDMHELGNLGVQLQGAVVATLKAKELMEYEDFYYQSGGEAYEVDEGLVCLDKPEDSTPYFVRARDLAFLALKGIRATSPIADPANKIM